MPEQPATSHVSVLMRVAIDSTPAIDFYRPAGATGLKLESTRAPRILKQRTLPKANSENTQLHIETG
jgi:hypothetical protein